MKQGDWLYTYLQRENSYPLISDILKSIGDPSLSVWTMDLQSVLSCPKTKTRALYYKTKLTVHNMTYFELNTKEVKNYIFDETNGDMSCHMFTYLHYNHLYRHL